MRHNKLKWKQRGPKWEDLGAMTPNAFALLAIVLQFCQDKNLPCMITNVKTKFKQSKSNTHPEGRAFDVRTRNWPNKHRNIRDCKVYVNRRAGKIAAFAKRKGKLVAVPAVYHDVGLGEHLHFQVRR